jgi:hypothetical protein
MNVLQPLLHDLRRRAIRLRRGDVPDFEQLSETPKDDLVPPLDRRRVDESKLSPHQLQWRREGVAFLPRFLPEDVMDAYCAVREKHPSPGGWECPVPYMHVPELRDLCLYPPLAKVLEDLLSVKMAVHLNLTGWISTSREWHQYDYLNPGFVNSWYAAVWMALDDIHPDSGPFQYVPGSHRWPVLRGERVRALLPYEEASTLFWPATAERIVTPLYEREIERTGLPVKTFLPRRGDVLVWHGRLVHRGSRPNDPARVRKALISHYTAVTKRLDAGEVAHTEAGVPYFAIHTYPLDFTAAPGGPRSM